MKRVLWSELGALTSAGTVAATILCCLPFATGVLGAALAAVGAHFEPYRPYLAGISLALLAYSFRGAYRSDSACATEGCDRPRAVRYRHVMTWVVAVVVFACLTAPWWANWVIYWTL